jgi:hypothetical protein
VERQSKIFEKHIQVTGIPFEKPEPKFSHKEIYSMTITAVCFFGLLELRHEAKYPATLIS